MVLHGLGAPGCVLRRHVGRAEPRPTTTWLPYTLPGYAGGDSKKIPTFRFLVLGLCASFSDGCAFWVVWLSNIWKGLDWFSIEAWTCSSGRQPCFIAARLGRYLSEGGFLCRLVLVDRYSLYLVFDVRGGQRNWPSTAAEVQLPPQWGQCSLLFTIFIN